MPHSQCSTPAHRSGVNVRNRSQRNGLSEWNQISSTSFTQNDNSNASVGEITTLGNHQQKHRPGPSTTSIAGETGSRGWESSSERPPHRIPEARNPSVASRTRSKTHQKDSASTVNHSKVPDNCNSSSNNTVATMETMTDSRFSCNICLESVEEPVVTQCGHLYCWPCLFRWLEPGMTIAERQSLQLPNILDNGDAGRRHCPVCKASCAVSNLIPIYVRSGDGSSKGELPVAAVAASPMEKRDASSQQEQVARANLPEAHIRETIPNLTHAAAVANRPSQTHLSEIDDKCSSSSTIATEQEDEDEDGNNDVDGDEDQDDIEPVSLQSQHDRRAAISTPPPAAALGALQRQRREPSPDNPLPGTLLVPNDNNGTDHRPRAFSENAVGALRQQNGISRTMAISQGLALSLHRALQPTSSTNSTAQAAAQAAASMIVPPLHRPEGFGNAAAMNTSVQHETDPDATEFLSRVLLMLASFVIFCLLLF